MSVTIQIQLREDTAANWTSANPTLLSAEVGYENDTGKFKFGDGVTAWSALPYFSTVTNDQIAVGNGTGAFDGSSSLTWDGTTLGVTGDVTVSAGTVDIRKDGLDQSITVFRSDLGVNDRSMQIKSPDTDSVTDPFRFQTGNAFVFTIDSTDALLLASDANATFAGDVTCNAFTSNGIDDNATQETLQLADNSADWGALAGGAVFSHVHKFGDQAMYFSGGVSASSGGNLVVFGATHATLAGDVQLRSSGNTFFDWDEDAGEAQILTGSGSKTLALTLDSSQNATFAGSIEADGNLTLNNSNTSIYLDDTSGSTAGTDRLQLNIDNDIFSIKSRTASTNALNEGVWVATNTAGSLTKQEFYIGNSVELTLTAGNATWAGDVDADGAFNLKPYCATGTGVDLTTTEATMDISTEVVTHADYSLATDQITIANTGTYQISYTVRVLEDGLGGATRSSTSFHMEIGGTTEIPQSYTSCYNREDSGPSGASTTFVVELTASDVLTLRGFVDFTSTSDVSQGATQVSIMRVA